MTPIAKVWIDEPACAANGFCMLKETHVFLKRDDSYVPAIANDSEKYFDSHRRQIIESVLSCPVAAIFLRYADGKEVSSNEFAASVEEWIDY